MVECSFCPMRRVLTVVLLAHWFVCKRRIAVQIHDARDLAHCLIQLRKIGAFGVIVLLRLTQVAVLLQREEFLPKSLADCPLDRRSTLCNALVAGLLVVPRSGS